jgi:AraC family transcriptional regulator, regulatory protein of adaptative response / methylated-DNA-[protein]-cysteine methyltransferase
MSIAPDSAVDYDSVLMRRWSAVQQRDKTQDGAFVYAVSTTGVYCRPSCPSRPARRENVSFHDSPVLAKQAGFRACKRCRPDDASADARRRELVVSACAALECSASGIKLGDLAKQVGMNAHHFHRVFKSTTGVTPKAYFQAVRAKRMQSALRECANVTSALYDAGFNSSSRFYEGASDALGMRPREFLDGGAGQQIRYATAPCALGVIVVAATAKGVCGIEFGDSAHALVERLRQRFPKAQVLPGDPPFNDWIGRVLRYVDHPVGLLDLPLDVRGTVFERQVWQALQTIPSGRTASYREVAEAIGRPTAVRAVARACASNSIAVAIPCHRVVRSDGGLSGYRWGPERKAELLRREQQEAQTAVDGQP